MLNMTGMLEAGITACFFLWLLKRGMRMRVVAGDLKGRKIEAVKGDNTRPTSDKIKETIFNVMGQFFAGGRALDLFAGSGNLGIEALSRGIESAIFIDADFQAVKTIKQNIKTLGLENQTEVYRNDAFKALKVLETKKVTFDLVFLDPPYGKIALTELLNELVVKDLLNNDALVVCEYGIGEDIQYDPAKLEVLKQAEYGTIGIHILRKR